MKRSSLYFVFLFTLLFAQQAALTHAAWHAGHSAPASQDGSGKASFHGSICALHGAFGTVLGGAHSSSLGLGLQQPPFEVPTSPDIPHVVFRLYTPPSRGPPILS